MKPRTGGVLLHLTSLPSPYGVGDLGTWAYRFADFLADARQGLWQILPLNPTSTAHGNSPYYSDSAFAGNPLLISPARMVADGLLLEADLQGLPVLREGRASYLPAEKIKKRLLQKAFHRVREGLLQQADFEGYCRENEAWLEDYSLFRALKKRFKGRGWIHWPRKIKDRRPDALQDSRKELSEDVLFEKFLQWVFHRQWLALKNHCAEKRIQIMGDIPIYVQHDSADVWAHRDLFKLDASGRPTAVAGVPPDYFSDTGQLWGNPVYAWDRLKATEYQWWIERIARNLKLYHLVRVDHFRGLVGYWEVPAGHKTALHGSWVPAPAEEFLNALFRRFPQLPVVAEDLGIITPDVWEVMGKFGLPGMKLLLFAFNGDMGAHPYAPHNLERNCVVYTGTHDNNTARGWFEKEASAEDKKRLFAYLGRKVGAREVSWELVRLGMMSVADTAVFPMQDLLGLGERARMNRPARADKNWLWRLLPQQLSPDLARRLAEITRLYGRG